MLDVVNTTGICKIRKTLFYFYFYAFVVVVVLVFFFLKRAP